MKRFTAISLALVLALGTLTACGGSEEPADNSVATESEAVTVVDDENAVDPADWAAYDALIAEVKSTTDYAEREAKMHEAEDILMETGAICPIYYYTDIYMCSDKIDGFFSSPLGFKYFMYASVKE